MRFDFILEKYRNISFSEHDKGNRFERLMQAYLLSDPKYSNRLKKVWLWNEFHGKSDLGGSDTGIDLVALTFDGDYWADEVGNPRYILDLLLSIITVSIETMKIVQNLPKLNFDEKAEEE